jgi:hypothetical protein
LKAINKNLELQQLRQQQQNFQLNVCYGNKPEFLIYTCVLFANFGIQWKEIFSSFFLIWYILIYFVGCTLPVTNGSTGDKVKEKVTGTKDKVKEKVTGTKDKVKETIGTGVGEGAKKQELGPGAASEVEEEVAKTSSDSPTKRVEGAGKALGKEEDSK